MSTIKTMDHRPRNEQLMHRDAPPTIRQLAEQTFSLQQEDHRENSARRQRDDTLYRRSVDPNLTNTRKESPDVTSMPKFTNEGIIQRRDVSQKHATKDDTQPSPQQQEPQKPPEPEKHSTLLHRVMGQGSGNWSNVIVTVLIVAAIAGICMLCSCNWQKKSE
jgi:hypothetical protein